MIARVARVAALAAVLAGLLVAFLSGSGSATGSRALSADRHPSIAPLPLPFPMPAAKAARFRAMDALRQRAAAIPATAPTGGSTAAGQTAGILGLHVGGPFSPAQFVGTNLWNGAISGKWLVVQAGGVPAAPPARPVIGRNVKAGVFVYWRSPQPTSSTPEHVVGIVRAPGNPRGALTVRRSAAGVLTLSLSGSGRIYQFSLRSLRFVG